MYNSAGKFFNFRRKLFFRGALVGPSRRGPSAPSSTMGFVWALARGTEEFFFPGRACQRYNVSNLDFHITLVVCQGTGRLPMLYLFIRKAVRIMLKIIDQYP